ncbi:MAG TPA: DUF4416 family protein [Candidatus Ornithospirochaeta stercorigallinarum]|nr:DUF4416 family protein [Candidatus Ornithospirochaeta stercorigallinarum]
MKERDYEKVLLFSGVLSSIGFPPGIRKALEERFGRIIYTSPSIPFTFTDYYDEEMGTPIERFFICFESLVSPDLLSDAKVFTNEIENRFAVDGKRKINLDPGTMSIGNIVLATTKNRAHRIAIGNRLYAELTLMYHHKGYESFPWTYADYKSNEVQDILLEMRRIYLDGLKKHS